jgi:hypothetical protein
MMAAFFDALIGRDRNPSGSSLPMRKLSNILRPSAYEVRSSSVQGPASSRSARPFVGAGTGEAGRALVTCALTDSNNYYINNSYGPPA